MGLTVPLIMCGMISHIVAAQYDPDDIFTHLLAQDGLSISLIWRDGAPAVLKDKDKAIHKNNLHILNAAEKAEQDQIVADNTGVHRLCKQRNMIGLHQHLVRTKANVNWVNPITTMTSLCVVLDKEMENGAHMLLNKKADPSVRCEAMGNAYPIHLACRRALPATVKRLIAYSANIHARDKKTGQVSLHYAAKRGNAEVLRTLIEAKADMEAMDRMRRKPLAIAAVEGHHECVMLMTSEVWAKERAEIQARQKIASGLAKDPEAARLAQMAIDADLNRILIMSIFGGELGS